VTAASWSHAGVSTKSTYSRLTADPRRVTGSAYTVNNNGQRAGVIGQRRSRLTCLAFGLNRPNFQNPWKAHEKAGAFLIRGRKILGDQFSSLATRDAPCFINEIDLRSDARLLLAVGVAGKTMGNVYHTKKRIAHDLLLLQRFHKRECGWHLKLPASRHTQGKGTGP